MNIMQLVRELVPEAHEFFNGQPLFTLLFFYVVALVTAYLMRRLANMTCNKGSVAHFFWVEFIAVTLQCTCAHENGIVVKHYGRFGFISVVFLLMTVSSILNPGSYSNPMRVVETVIRKEITVRDGITVGVAQLCGLLSGSSIAYGIWYYTRNLFDDHSRLYEGPCAFNYIYPLPYAFAFEIVAAFLIRVAAVKLGKDRIQVFLPAMIAGLLTMALIYIGVPGINPIVITSRMYHCYGITASEFGLIYWFCPAVGYAAAAWLTSRGSNITPPLAPQRNIKKPQHKNKKKTN